MYIKRPFSKYNDVFENISDADINRIVEDLVKRYDMSGKFLDYSIRAKVYLEQMSINISSMYEQIEEHTKFRVEYLVDPANYLIMTSEEIVEYERDKVYDEIVGVIVSMARNYINNREHLRMPIGSVVDFSACDSYYVMEDNVFFYKDGGWGIADKNGKVIVKNHIKENPSSLRRLFNEFLIITDCDSKKKGVISSITLKEILHCIYDDIDNIVPDNNSNCNFIIVKYNSKYGCFDSNFSCVLHIEYKDIVLKNGFIETTDYNNNLCMYDYEGNFMIGGYQECLYENGYFKLYYGRLYEESLCLVVDKNFRLIVKPRNGDYLYCIGHYFCDTDALLKFIPAEFLFKYRVDLSDVGNGFIYMYKSDGDVYFIPESEDEYKKNNKSRKKTPQPAPAPPPKDGELFTGTFSSKTERPLVEREPFILYDSQIENSLCGFSAVEPIDSQEKLIVDDLVYINHFNKNGIIDWTSSVNELGTALLGFKKFQKKVYRIGSTCGFYTDKGLEPPFFFAITKYEKNGTHCLAQIDIQSHTKAYNSLVGPMAVIERTDNDVVTMVFYLINEDGSYTNCFEDYKKFNPSSLSWFPKSINKNMICRMDDCFNNCQYDPRDSLGVEWTMEDAWDALTDGAYGDYPDAPGCFDGLIDIMGF